MRCGSIRPRILLSLAAFGLALAAPALVFGQAGVVVDARGVLHTKTEADSTGQLNRQRILAARASLNPKVAATSKLRYISLRRLEEAVRGHQGAATEEMRNLAGLLRVHYVFLYPDSKDIVIAGPAEGWVNDGFGRPVGLSSGRPVIRLEDLVVALRAFPPGGSRHPADRLLDRSDRGGKCRHAAVPAAHRLSAPPPTIPSSSSRACRRTSACKRSASTASRRRRHFAMVLVEADYRMKLIGIGLEKPPIRMVSYIDRATRRQRTTCSAGSSSPITSACGPAEDGMAMELVGDGVKLVGENEVVTSGGQRQPAGHADAASQAFTTAFTKKYSALADRAPVYAELRNLIDLAVAAAYIQHEDFYGKADWKMDLFGDETAFTRGDLQHAEAGGPGDQRDLAGHTLMTPIGGGVHIEPTRPWPPATGSPTRTARSPRPGGR